eukprot:TRINITY_DN59371_c0_g1_i1.p1 TRINITY_DN59371_c0_g1~~TRINITY_DN59371_c0_g1_i1.p1  ORF type:complete len:338 (+),score=57.83 TRINITY_DN59371_c0_g1_i1:69-1082(+)
MGRRIIFSDIDGTLVHLERDLEELGQLSADALEFAPAGRGSLAIRPLPASSTGLQGFISERTLRLVAELRRAGHLVVLISGARSSTFMQRLPFLPAADAYAMENGGRIFMRDTTRVAPTAAPMLEDLAWRNVHSSASPPVPESIPPSERPGLLWDLFRKMEQDGWALDTNSYMTSFRVSIKKSRGKTDADLSRMIQSLPSEISCSFNLGQADFYPATSGKDKAAQYLMQKFSMTKLQSVSMGDDDNDLGLAAVVHHTYVPGFTAESMRTAVAKEPAHFTVAKTGGFLGTEEMLEQMVVDFQQGSFGYLRKHASVACSLAALFTFLAAVGHRKRLWRQ